MRILGFSEKRDKLVQEIFTTFRFKRKDKDWAVGEIVKVVYHPRHKDHQFICIAEIVEKEQRAMAWHGDKTGVQKVSNTEAIADGFEDTPDKLAYFHMWEFMWGNYGGERLLSEPMNKLTLRLLAQEKG
jgi:hypothetical protein